MNKKSILILVGLLIVIIGGAFWYTTYNSPDQKVSRLEDQIGNKKESSGYNVCMAKVGTERQKYDDCVQQKLTAQGYTDGLNCIMNSENPVCSSQTPEGLKRYNAEIYAGNDCAKELGMEQLSLTELDCAKLLE